MEGLLSTRPTPSSFPILQDMKLNNKMSSPLLSKRKQKPISEISLPFVLTSINKIAFLLSSVSWASWELSLKPNYGVLDLE